MKNIIIIFVLLTGIFTCNAQLTDVDQMFGKRFSINGLIRVGIPVGATIEETVAAFGSNYTASNKDSDLYGPLTYHQYGGLELIFIDDGTLLLFTITGSKYFLKIGDHSIKVGSPIDTIKKGFPKSYNSRKSTGTLVLNGDDAIDIVIDGNGIIKIISYYIPS